MNESRVDLLFRYKKTIAIVFSIVLYILLFLFIYYYPLRIFYFSLSSSHEGDSSFTALLDTGDLSPITASSDQGTIVPIGNQLDEPSMNRDKSIDTSIDISIPTNISDSQAKSESLDEILHESADSLLDTLDNLVPTDQAEEEDTSKDEVPSVSYAQVYIPEVVMPVVERSIDKESVIPQKRVRKRRVRKIIRKRGCKKTIGSTIFNKANLEQARQEAFKGSYGEQTGNSHKYNYVTQRLQAQRMMCYNSRIGKILQGEFARYKTPITFEQDLVQMMPGKIIINKDGTVHDYICDNPTGVKEFDEFVKKIIMQSKFTALPRFYAHDTYEIPFDPKVHAQKGTNVFKLYLPEDERYPWENF